MNEKIFEEITAAAFKVESARSELKSRLKNFGDAQGESFPLNEIIPGADYTIADIFSALSSLNTLVDGVSVKDAGPSLPRIVLTTFLGKLNELEAQLVALVNLFEAVAQNGGARSLNVAELAVLAANESAHQFAKPFRRLFDAADAALAAWYQVRFIARSPKISEFGKYVSEIEQQKDAVQRTLERVEDAASQIAEKNNKSQAVLDQSAALQNEVSRIAQEIQNDRRTITEYTSDATTKLAEIRSTEEKSAALLATVTGYQAQFDNFDAQLAARVKRFEDEGAALLAVRDQLAKEQQEVVRLIAESEGLLRGATNVGLASSFSGLQTKIEGELKWAEISFYVSIGVLVLLSLPIALYVFPGLQALLRAIIPSVPDIAVARVGDSHTTPDVIAQVAARALLLIPGIWLVRFAGARHERLFRLREHYAYKYSIASSVEGFKKQAPDMEQGIAATAFYELTFNPANRMDANSTESRHPNPAMEWLMKKLGGSTDGAPPK